MDHNYHMIALRNIINETRSELIAYDMKLLLHQLLIEN